MEKKEEEQQQSRKRKTRLNASCLESRMGHRPCRRDGIGHYLLLVSGINQFNLAFFAARLTHLIINIGETSSSSPTIRRC
jgi:hypothetical protein